MVFASLFVCFSIWGVEKTIAMQLDGQCLSLINKVKMANNDEQSNDGNLFTNFFTELLSSPLNLALLGFCGFLLYKIIVGQKKQEPPRPREPELPKLKKQDMTLEQLREYDGKGPDGRILLAANGKVFDVTRGKRFYGPGKFLLLCI